VGEARHRNPLWLAGGLLLVVLCALGGVLLFSTADDRTKVVVAAADLNPGRPLASGDMRVVEMVLDDGVEALSPAEAGKLVGLRPVGRVPAGTLLNEAMFATATPLGADEIVVGAALEPGAAPQSQFDVGADVELLYAPKTTGSLPAAVVPATVLGRGTVWAVEPLATGQIWVSIRVPAAIGQAAAQASQDGALRVVFVGAAP
jgi:hypothetical protein